MDAVDREELIGLLAEALMRDPTFRQRRRHWAADADRCRLEARICAAGLVDHLHLCGIRLVAPPARAGVWDQRLMLAYAVPGSRTAGLFFGYVNRITLYTNERAVYANRLEPEGVARGCGSTQFYQVVIVAFPNRRWRMTRK